ncbi:lamin tail domain-containing protein [Zobellia amurskyensis]|uniref:Lamin tail domain-containing protein n=1 Tax=Zobellia amurskyensis TaxID=248905 RepID=A0A7X3D387_9FLAO|nr:DUF5689 domain-containing protein [Zobellia amurskyensis]MUH37383.1 lamin tail domain-containing protein [Zobellia amurskyensis]
MRESLNLNRLLLNFSVFMAVCFCSCVKSRNYEEQPSDCFSDLTANITYAEVKNLYKGDTFQIQEDLIIEGVVVSSDGDGNFFSVLYFQDSAVNPTEGFQIEIDVRDSHLFYPVGAKIGIKLKGLYLGRSKDVFKLGATFTSFGNVSVGRLPTAIVNEHIFRFCNEKVTVDPTVAAITGMRKELTNTLVTFHNVEFKEEELGRPFAEAGEETERILVDCDDNEIVMLNSGYSDFQPEVLPEGRGSVTGILLRENENYKIGIRSISDINFDQERCAELIDEFTSENILISELADPDNNASARFVELYNSSSEDLNLKGWKLRRFTNANTEVSSEIDLSALTIAADGFVVISPNAEEFEAVYKFTPDLGVGTNSPADSNGDDNLQLVDPFGKIIDVFGVVGEDGTGTNHEFEDGRAIRRPEVLKGNANFNFDEWQIWNDSGSMGTIKQVKIAPDDFSPKEKN